MGLLKRDERTSTRCVGDSGLGPSSMYRHSCGWALGVRGPGSRDVGTRERQQGWKTRPGGLQFNREEWAFNLGAA